MEWIINPLTKHYFDFSGRAARKEFWMFTLWSIGISIVFSVIGIDTLKTLVSLVLLIPSVAISVRRLHDTSHNGWWLLIAFIPIIGWIILIVWYCTDSHPDNGYGPNPKNSTVLPVVPPQASTMA